MDNNLQVELFVPAKVEDRLHDKHGVFEEVSNSVIAVVAEEPANLPCGVVVVDRKNSFVFNGMIRIGRGLADSTKTFLFGKHSFKSIAVDTVAAHEVGRPSASTPPECSFVGRLRRKLRDVHGWYGLNALTVGLLGAARFVQQKVVVAVQLVAERAWTENIPTRALLDLFGLSGFSRGSDAIVVDGSSFVSTVFAGIVSSASVSAGALMELVSFSNLLTDYAYSLFLSQGRAALAFLGKVPSEEEFLDDLLTPGAFSNLCGFRHMALMIVPE